MKAITLSYPNMKLSPNRKHGQHWTVTQSAKKEAFEAGFYGAKLIYTEKFESKPTPLRIIFVQSDKRKRDLDGLLSASKNMIDGIAKGIGIDDSFFEPITLERGYDKDYSYMRVEIG